MSKSEIHFCHKLGVIQKPGLRCLMHVQYQIEKNNYLKGSPNMRMCRKQIMQTKGMLVSERCISSFDAFESFKSLLAANRERLYAVWVFGKVPLSPYSQV